MFGWEFPPFNSGGLGVACEGMSKALSASGVDLTFVLPVKMPVSAPWCRFVFANDKDQISDEAVIRSLFAGYQSHVDEKIAMRGVLSGNISGSLLQRVRAYAMIAPSIARKVSHSIIHVHDWLTYPAGIAAKRASGRPLVAHIHATEFDRSGSDSVNSEIYEIEREGFSKADVVVAVSRRTGQKVIDKYGIDPRKVKVVYNGVEFKNSGSTIEEGLKKIKEAGNSIVLFVGRITLQKGPDYFVAMAKKVLEERPNTYFVISGSGDMEQQMIRSVSEKGIASRFIFCGFLRGDELEKVYKAADIFVMPSVSEPFGLVPVEAMISEVPVLVSKESGVSEILSAALKSHFWDIDDIADKVISVLDHKPLKNHLSRNGCDEAKTIHWKKAADSLISVYNSLDNAFGVFLFPSTSAHAGAQVPGF
jgi:glycosyltransferase involved in cell wall biosynthesis